MIQLLCAFRHHRLGRLKKYVYGGVVAFYVRQCPCARRGKAVAQLLRDDTVRVPIGSSGKGYIH